MRSHQIIMVLLPEDVFSASSYGETRGEPNLCSSDQYPITFTYLAVFRAGGPVAEDDEGSVSTGAPQPPRATRMCVSFVTENESNVVSLTSTSFNMSLILSGKWGRQLQLLNVNDPMHCGCALAARLQQA